MAKNELTTNKMFTELGNAELKNELNTINLSVKLGNQTAWTVAKSYANIVNNNLFEDDFDNLKEMADYIEVSKSLISQYVNAYNFVSKTDEEGQPLFYNTLEHLTAHTLTVGKAYTLSTLKDEAGTFISWCASNNRLITAMSDKGLKATIKEWREELEALEVEAEDEYIPDGTGEEVISDEEFEDVAVVEYEGKTYLVPLEVLYKYEA